MMAKVAHPLTDWRGDLVTALAIGRARSAPRSFSPID